MHSPAPEPTHDALNICLLLKGPLSGVTHSELQSLAYLACLLSLYDGHPVNDWGYRFVTTEWGSPYSNEIWTTIEALLISGRLKETPFGLILSPTGEKVWEALKDLESFSTRKKYIEAACNSVLALPRGTVRNALHKEPTIKSALVRIHGGELLDEAEPAIEILYEQFSALHNAIGDRVSDLLTPSVVWLQYLAHMSEAPAQRSEG